MAKLLVAVAMGRRDDAWHPLVSIRPGGKAQPDKSRMKSWTGWQTGGPWGQAYPCRRSGRLARGRAIRRGRWCRQIPSCGAWDRRPWP